VRRTPALPLEHRRAQEEEEEEEGRIRGEKYGIMN
jgi:hypothetical protein